MARFRFKLEGVLRHREHVEREHQRIVSELMARMAEMQQQLQEIDRTVADSTEHLRSSHLTGTIDLNYLTAHRRFVAAQRSRAAELIQQMARLQQQIEQARKALAEAAKQRKILEKLREKRLARWRADQVRAEMTQLDEVGMQLSFANLAVDEGDRP